MYGGQVAGSLCVAKSIASREIPDPVSVSVPWRMPGSTRVCSSCVDGLEGFRQVARYRMAAVTLYEFRWLDDTDGLRLPAAGTEPTTGWRPFGAGYVAREDDAPPNALDHRIRLGYGRQERLGVGMPGLRYIRSRVPDSTILPRYMTKTTGSVGLGLAAALAWAAARRASNLSGHAAHPFSTILSTRPGSMAATSTAMMAPSWCPTRLARSISSPSRSTSIAREKSSISYALAGS